MALIAIQDWQFYAVIAIAALFFFAGIGIYLYIRSRAPDALEHAKADRICRVHYKNRKDVDYVPNEKKEEKELGAKYWEVPTIGLKFKPEAGKSHFVEGSIPCVNYYENTTEPIMVEEAVAFSQLADYFKKMGMPIDGIEDIAFYASYENEKLNDKQRAINNARITSDETKKHIKKYLDFVDAHKKEITEMQIHSGQFTWLTAMRAIDSAIALSSAHLANARETIRAAEKRKLEAQGKDWMKYMFIAFMAVIIGIILLYGLQGLNK